MTIYDASGKLFNWFKENDSFVMEEDFKKLILISEEKERETACVTAALNHLESIDLIKKEKMEEKEIWLLCKSFKQFEQNVEISADTCAVIADIINEFCDLIDDTTDYCDASSITEKDITNLLLIYQQTKNIALEKTKEDLI